MGPHYARMSVRGVRGSKCYARISPSGAAGVSGNLPERIIEGNFDKEGFDHLGAGGNPVASFSIT